MTRPNMSHMSALGQKTALDEPMEAPFSLGEALPKILQQEPTNAGSQSNITGGIGQGDNGFGNLINISEDDVHGPGDIWPHSNGMWAARNKVGEMDFFDSDAEAQQFAGGANGFTADHLPPTEAAPFPMDGGIETKSMDPRFYEDPNAINPDEERFERDKEMNRGEYPVDDSIIPTANDEKEMNRQWNDANYDRNQNLGMQQKPYSDVQKQHEDEWAEFNAWKAAHQNEEKPFVPTNADWEDGYQDVGSTEPPDLDGEYTDWLKSHPENSEYAGKICPNCKAGDLDGSGQCGSCGAKAGVDIDPYDMDPYINKDGTYENIQLESIILNEWRENGTVWRKQNGGFGAKNRRGKLKYFKTRATALQYARTGSTAGSIKDVVMEKPVEEAKPEPQPELPVDWLQQTRDAVKQNLAKAGTTPAQVMHKMTPRKNTPGRAYNGLPPAIDKKAKFVSAKNYPVKEAPIRKAERDFNMRQGFSAGPEDNLDTERGIRQAEWDAELKWRKENPEQHAAYRAALGLASKPFEAVSTQLEDYLPQGLEERNYKQEYANYQSRPDQKKNRAMRNKVRREALRTGTAKKGDGKDIHHKDMNPHNDGKQNLAVVDKGTNRSNNRHHPGEKMDDEVDTFKQTPSGTWSTSTHPDSMSNMRNVKEDGGLEDKKDMLLKAYLLDALKKMARIQGLGEVSDDTTNANTDIKIRTQGRSTWRTPREGDRVHNSTTSEDSMKEGMKDRNRAAFRAKVDAEAREKRERENAARMDRKARRLGDKERRHQAAQDVEADYAPDSNDPPESKEF